MSLDGRVAKIESIRGRRRMPSDRDLQAAEELLRLHAAVEVAAIFGVEPDPDEVRFVRMAEKSGRIAAAKDLRQRYWRTRGVDIEARARVDMQEFDERLKVLFGNEAR